MTRLVSFFSGICFKISSCNHYDKKAYIACWNHIYPRWAKHMNRCSCRWCRPVIFFIYSLCKILLQVPADLSLDAYTNNRISVVSINDVTVIIWLVIRISKNIKCTFCESTVKVLSFRSSLVLCLPLPFCQAWHLVANQSVGCRILAGFYTSEPEPKSGQSRDFFQIFENAGLR